MGTGEEDKNIGNGRERYGERKGGKVGDMEREEMVRIDGKRRGGKVVARLRRCRVIERTLSSIIR
jgi:hypothetical protein